jgi:dihydroneopterin aldolase
MLASVGDRGEAEIAIAGGADIIDLKDPSRGAFGAVDPATVRDTVIAVAGRRPVSAVLGEVPMQPGALADAVAAMAEAGADTLKLGFFFPAHDPDAIIRALAPLARRQKLIAVLFADLAPDLALLPRLAAGGFVGAMLDTAAKGGAGLLEQWDLPALRRFVLGCREQHLLCGLAGGLEAPDVPRLLVLDPDVLGFRSALCGEAGRAGPIEPAAVRAIRALIPPQAGQAGAGAVDYRLLAARGYAPDLPQGTGATDRVFVRDLVLPVRIGAYSRERSRPQRVRFAVEASVLRALRPSQDMRDVFSYDLIIDAIRMVVDAGHIALVETLAERIADTLLAHRRIVRVAVQVEKLDLGVGMAGVAIERNRSDVAPARSAGRGAGGTVTE